MGYLPVLVRLIHLQSGRLPGLRDLYREDSAMVRRAHLDVGGRKSAKERKHLASFMVSIVCITVLAEQTLCIKPYSIQYADIYRSWHRT